MNTANKDYSFEFTSSQNRELVYGSLLNVRQWWSGLFGEEIEGSSEKINDVFTFCAGGGVHESVQKLIELVPNEKITWLVTESNLNFLENPNEWANTRIGFEISGVPGNIKVRFTHFGLQPQIECYSQCTDAWTLYMRNLENRLK